MYFCDTVVYLPKLKCRRRTIQQLPILRARSGDLADVHVVPAFLCIRAPTKQQVHVSAYGTDRFATMRERSNKHTMTHDIGIGIGIGMGTVQSNGNQIKLGWIDVGVRLTMALSRPNVAVFHTTPRYRGFATQQSTTGVASGPD